MAGFGWHNPMPMLVGGGPSDAERVYLVLRKAIGEDAPGPEGGMEDLWRRCRAVAIAASLSADERAALQAFPLEATDHLPVYEALLGVPEAPTIAERQRAVSAAFARRLGADTPTLLRDLRAIDPSVSITPIDPARARTVQFGMAFGPRTGGPAYGSGQSASVTASAYPNFSDHFITRVSYSAGVDPNELKLTRLRAHLNDALPAWEDFEVYSGGPFYFDGGPDGSSRLDLTAMSE